MPAAAFPPLAQQRGLRCRRPAGTPMAMSRICIGKAFGSVDPAASAFGVVEAGRRLHQRVEAAPVGPRAGCGRRPTARRRRCPGAARPRPRDRIRGAASAARPIALQHHVRARQRRARTRRGPRRIGEIGKRRSLAAAGVGDRLDVRQLRRVDEHHVGAVGGERAAGRPGRRGCGSGRAPGCRRAGARPARASARRAAAHRRSARSRPAAGRRRRDAADAAPRPRRCAGRPRPRPPRRPLLRRRAASHRSSAAATCSRVVAGPGGRPSRRNAASR